MKPSFNYRIFCIYGVVVTLLLFSLLLKSTAFAIEISDVPLGIQLNSPPPNVMLVWDNSASMDAEFMTTEPEGLFETCYYLFPEDSYTPQPDFVRSDKCVLSSEKRHNWLSQWSGYNRLYYDPYDTYTPWPSTSKHHFADADLQCPWSHPMRTADTEVRTAMANPFMTVERLFQDIVIPNAHYFVFVDANGNGQHDSDDTVYLVAWQDQNSDGVLDLGNHPEDDRRLFFLFTDDGDDQVEANELRPIHDHRILNEIKPFIYDSKGTAVRHKTDREDLQNFVNWFSYHRKREFVAKSVVAQSIIDSRQQYMGIYALNSAPRTGVMPVHVSAIADATAEQDTDSAVDELDRSEALIDILYSARSQDRTPLRRALYEVGRYFDQTSGSHLGDSPIKTEELGGSCQRNYALIITDGFWNGSFTELDNIDGALAQPYGDEWSGTLADVAAYYYHNDLAPDLPDRVSAIQCDDAAHQHMVTHTLSFGINGTINIEDINGDGLADSPGYKEDPCFNYTDTPRPLWPQPGADESTTIDDLWHAAVNGRGQYLNADDSNALSEAVSGILGNIGAAISTTGLSVNGQQLTSQTVLYQTRFRSDIWTGDLYAFPYGAKSEQGEYDGDDILWHAAEQFRPDNRLFDRRRIITYGGPWKRPGGVAFRYESLSSDQRELLGSDLVSGSVSDQKARQIVDYIRGLDASGFRARTNVLGDIVHSAPVVVNETVFVGANDGMLHAFDVNTGKERFAYIPNLVFDHLKSLSDVDYEDHHKYYVDATPFAGEVFDKDYRRKTYLIGGLGKGGKGYYCLHIGSRSRKNEGNHFGDYETEFSVDDYSGHTAESDIGAVVKWEYPQPNIADDGLDNDGDGLTDELGEADPDIGYSFGQGYVANANTAENTFRAVAIFSNGYDSPGGKAILYVLDAQTGQLIRKIDTGAGDDNGLSIPALIDVNLDRCVDYVYAGDLKGNLWKFDLTSSDPKQWGLAYGDDRNQNGMIDAMDGDSPQPVFRSPGQAITGRPDVMAMAGGCAPLVHGYMVIFGTGKYLGSSDRLDISQQSIYGIWDYGDDSDDSETVGTIESRSTGDLSSKLTLARLSIVSQISEQGDTYRVLSDWQADYSTVEDVEDADHNSANNTNETKNDNPIQYAGWFLDFPMPPDPNASVGERVTANVTIRGGKAIVTSFSPINGFCGCGGTSWLYVLNGCGDFQFDPDRVDLTELPRHYDNRIADRLLILKDTEYPQKDKIICSDQSGRLQEQDFIGEKWGKVFWRQNYTDN